MKTIEIVTAQKVDISYPLAGLMQRILAYFIDTIVIGLIYYILVLLLLWIVPFNNNFQETYVYVVLMPIILFYHLIFEYFWNGQSLGKKALGIRVIKASGDRPEFVDYFMRWMFRTIDIAASFGLVAIVSILANDKRQRLGDIISNMAVIQVQSTRNYTLKDVMNIMKLKQYEITFPEAKMFNEAQMLLVKETLERNTKYKNDAHIIALKKLAAKLSNAMGTPPPKNNKQFLKVLLRDYIYLTR